jgi:hypothetical protein
VRPRVAPAWSPFGITDPLYSIMNADVEGLLHAVLDLAKRRSSPEKGESRATQGAWTGSVRDLQAVKGRLHAAPRIGECWHSLGSEGA